MSQFHYHRSRAVDSCRCSYRALFVATANEDWYIRMLVTQESRGPAPNLAGAADNQYWVVETSRSL
jgi:hypothetical protein